MDVTLRVADASSERVELRRIGVYAAEAQSLVIPVRSAETHTRGVKGDCRRRCYRWHATVVVTLRIAHASSEGGKRGVVVRGEDAGLDWKMLV